MDCVAHGICTAGSAQPEAERIASLNSDDGQATVDASDIDFDLSQNEVRVTVHTLDATDGDGEIDHTLAPVLGESGTGVSATALARWGAPAGGIALAVITIVAIVPLALFVFKDGPVESFRLSGVPQPETFRQACLKARQSFAGVEQARVQGVAV